MKRRDFITHLEKNKCLFKREGGSHTIYINPLNNKISTIPRHKEIKENLVKKICKDLEIPAP
jgi:mRNA interferase HicA